MGIKGQGESEFLKLLHGHARLADDLAKRLYLNLTMTRHDSKCSLSAHLPSELDVASLLAFLDKSRAFQFLRHNALGQWPKLRQYLPER